MRLKLEGQSDISRIGEALHKLIELQPEGATWHAVNIYLTLRSAEGEEIELEIDGDVLQTLLFKNPATKRVSARKKEASSAEILHLKPKSKAR